MIAITAIACGVLCGCVDASDHSAVGNLTDQQYVRDLLVGSTPFARERLLHDARVAVFSDPRYEPDPWSINGALVCGADPMYVEYDSTTGQEGPGSRPAGGIGILEMGKVLPIVTWPRVTKTFWHLAGCAGRRPIISHSTSDRLYVISGGRPRVAGTDISAASHEFDNQPSLTGGATCRIVRLGNGRYLEATARNGHAFRLLDSPALAAALKGFEKSPTIRSYCFRFATHDFVEFSGYNTDGVIYRIDQGRLTLIGGAGVLAGDADHVLLMFDDVDRRWYNEERAP